MITLEPNVETQLQTLASEQGVSVSELIKKFILEYQSEQDAIVQADQAYADYKKTGQSISLEQLIKNNDLDG